eukprot:scaffold402_cov70-Skeletonema_dohrnii-CCMP3373.AAC.2
MVSRKKAKGKARKAAKAMKEEEKEAHNDSSAAAAQQREQEGALEAHLQLQMQRLIIDIDSLPSPCKHGFVPFLEGHTCDLFLKLYLSAYSNSSEDADSILVAMAAVEEKYPEVLHDSSKMKAILSYFLAEGTDFILNGNDDAARITATKIVMFEECIAYRVLKTQAVMHLQKAIEILIADDHTLIRSTKKSNPSKRWATATVISVLSLVGRLNVARCCTAPSVDMHITVPVTVKRPIGEGTRSPIRLVDDVCGGCHDGGVNREGEGCFVVPFSFHVDAVSSMILVCASFEAGSSERAMIPPPAYGSRLLIFRFPAPCAVTPDFHFDKAKRRLLASVARSY